MSKEQQAQEQPQVAIPLPKAKKNLVQIGCICMMLSVAMYGLVFATLTAPILEKVDAMGYVGLFSIVGAIGVSIMTPIGGKLGDLIGRRNIVVIPGIICALAGFAFAFVRSLIPLMILRLIVSLAQGAFTAAPYIIAGLINERKDVPKAMGMLATAIAVGGFGGSIIAGILTDMGLLTVAILMPAIPLILGIVLIGMNMPNQKREGKVTIDVPGMIALIVNIENKAAEPLIPMKLFKNKNYTVLLIVGFICYFYQNAMNYYAPIGAMQVMGASTSAAGALQMPRTLITIILPTIAGAWVGKKAANAWKAMVIGTSLAMIPMAVMALVTNSGASIMIYFVALAVTGIAESFRAVSITPTAQEMLAPEDMGIGTSLVNFANSLSGTIAVAVFAVAYNASTSADPTNVALIQNGVKSVFWTAAVVTLIGLLLVIFIVKPEMSKKAAESK